MNFAIDINEVEGQFSKLIKIDEGADFDIQGLMEIIERMENDTSLVTFRLKINENVLKLLMDLVIEGKFKHLNYEKGYYSYFKRVDPYNSHEESDDENFKPDCSLPTSLVNDIKNLMKLKE